MMKRVNRNILVMGAAAAMGCALTGTAFAQEAITFTPGTYQGNCASGHAGNVAVEVTLSENAIEDITVTENNETSGIGDVAAAHIIEDILTNQSLDVDGVSGCTISAAAFRLAIEDALTSAGADVDALRKVEKQTADPVAEEMDADVVVIGSGAAGLTAAIEAAKGGANVVVLEKMARNGGATRTSSGMIVAGGTSLQEEAGIEDSVENLKEYWYERGEDNVDTEFVDFVAENINASLEDFISWGVSYSPELILQSGTATINRAHMPAGAGAELCDKLVMQLDELGVDILTETDVKALVQSDDGAIVGVEAQTRKGTLNVSAKSVIVATGGYGWNPDLIKEYSPKAEGAWSMSSPGNTGDGLVMAMEVGADTVFKGGFIGWKVCTPAYDHTTAIGAPIYGAANLIVNTNGDRFCNEALDYPFVYNAMQEDGSDRFYWIFESAGETKDLVNNVSNTVANLELGVEAGVVYKADTVEELAEVSGLTNLAASVEAYNSAIENGEDAEFGRDTATMTALDEGPFYAIVSQRATLGTFGGLNTNVTGEVVNAQGEAISGLYAAGEVANGEFFPVIYPASGSSISMCVTLGKEAGKNAAAFALAQ